MGMIERSLRGRSKLVAGEIFIPTRPMSTISSISRNAGRPPKRSTLPSPMYRSGYFSTAAATKEGGTSEFRWGALLAWPDRHVDARLVHAFDHLLGAHALQEPGLGAQATASPPRRVHGVVHHALAAPMLRLRKPYVAVDDHGGSLLVVCPVVRCLLSVVCKP